MRGIQLDVVRSDTAGQHNLAFEEHVEAVGGLTLAGRRSRADVLAPAFAARYRVAGRTCHDTQDTALFTAHARQSLRASWHPS